MLRLPAGIATALVAALLLAPSLLVGTLPSHSSPHDILWASQFSDQFRTGILYPRWMPDSFDELGGPAFYFYPPFAFWLDGLLRVVTFGAVDVSYRLSLVALLLLWASGVTMYLWLRAWPLDHRAALIGAFLYQLAPYHLTDHYVRGAIGEFAVYAALPLVMLGIRTVAERSGPSGPVLLALAYATLLVAHLPTALLVSAIGIPAYVLYLAWSLDRKAFLFVLRAALAGLLGLGIAALYLLPAVKLQDFISVEQFWTGPYHVQNWFLLAQDWTDPSYTMSLVLLATIACTAFAAGVLAYRPRQKEAILWAGLAIGGGVLISGFFPSFWKVVPLVSKVQFPYRLLVLIEFATITALCGVRWQYRPRATYLCFSGAIAAGVLALAVLTSGVRVRVEKALAHDVEAPHDAKEYLPAGYPQRRNAAYSDLGLDPVKGLPLIACQPRAHVCNATPGRFGAVDAEIDAVAPTVVVLRRFYFPGWRLDPAGAVVPTVPLHLVSFEIPAGRNYVHLRREPLAVEKYAEMISGLSLLLLFGWAVSAWRQHT